MQRILIVEDEPVIAEVVDFALARAGFATACAETLTAARSALAGAGVDLVILDLGLPDGDGLELCRELERASTIPVVVLTCRDEELDRVLGLESGADDYVVKPFSPRELVARVRSVLRRCGRQEAAQASETLRYGRITVIPDEHHVCLDGAAIRLTPVELGLLTALLRSPQRVHTRPALIEQVYHPSCFLSERTIDSHIKGIRRKFARIEATADPIETIFGVGYRARKLS
jgi:DNA-binding response OmpR family regulator